MFVQFWGSFWRSCWGYFQEPFWNPKMERQDGWNAAKRRQNVEEFEAGEEYSPPCTDFLQKSGRISCRKGLETPLAAGLAAGAGGLGSLEALAVHPWAQEFCTLPKSFIGHKYHREP